MLGLFIQEDTDQLAFIDTERQANDVRVSSQDSADILLKKPFILRG